MKRVALVVAAVALVAAVLGGTAALVVAESAGWVGGDGETRTVVVREPGTTAPPAPPPPPASRPLPAGDFDAARIYAERSAGVVTVYASFGGPGAGSQGSGFVVSADGVVLTNSHVITTAGDRSGPVQAAPRVFVEFQNRDRVPAEIVGWDVFDDVGVLRVDPDAHPLSPVPLGDSSAVVVGEPVAAIGSPFGNEGSLAVGVVAATRSIASLTSRYSLPDAIQVDAPINHGNSGGPLFDARGRVIGITAQIRSTSGTAEGVGFAVPINAARRSMQQLLATGTVAYGYLGISAEDVTPSVAQAAGYPVRYGAAVTAVQPGTAAARAGLRAGDDVRELAGREYTVGGDVIVALGGAAIRNADDLVRAVANRLPRERVVVTLYRDGKRLRVPVVLGARPQDPE